jgi:enoyl-CoA hydratase/carnithine racemase
MADDYQTICLQCADAVATLTLNRPQRLNAINKQMLAELQHALETVERDPDVRALIVNGAGGNFSSGFDLSEQMEARPSGVEVWREILERDLQYRHAVLAFEQANYRGRQRLLSGRRLRARTLL